MKKLLILGFAVMPTLVLAQAIYGPQGRYQGTTTAPVTATPNTAINVPRQAPQAPTVKGW